MKAGLTLKPGQPGTIKQVAKYGDQLLYVRYRYDEIQRKRFKTVELIIDEADWVPPGTPAPDEIVGVRVGVKEIDLQHHVRRAGGKWNYNRQVWEIRYESVVELGLQSRIVSEDEVPISEVPPPDETQHL